MTESAGQDPHSISNTTSDGMLLLEAASLRNGNLHVIRRLVDTGTDINFAHPGNGWYAAYFR